MGDNFFMSSNKCIFGTPSTILEKTKTVSIQDGKSYASLV